MKDCAKKISRTQTFLKIMDCEKSMKFHQKRKKKKKYWRIGEIVYSHFLIENWKVKTLGTITAHINIEKLNEKDKKMLNAKLKRHLVRPHTKMYEILPSSALILHLAFFTSFINLFYINMCCDGPKHFHFSVFY